jgi:phosphatidylserine/phosphatidylglycerophosphate/cardiolipin synthase-like enzyme
MNIERTMAAEYSGKAPIAGRMRRVAAAILALACTAPACARDSLPATAARPASGTVQLAFTPEDDVTGLIVSALDNAQREVYVQAFSFTSREIAGALLAARHRGVEVQVLADEEQSRRFGAGLLNQLREGGVSVMLDSEHQSAHNKVMIIDPWTSGQTVITGSFNFTYAAQHKNAENLLILRGNARLTEGYLSNWKKHRQHAIPWKMR